MAGVCQMGVEVNQAGKNGEHRPVHPFRALWRCAAGCNCRDPVVGDADTLIGENGACPNIHKFARCNILVGGNCGRWQKSEKHRQ